MESKAGSEPLRPRDLAILLLASRDLLPRRRARDQQADLAGMELKRKMLNRLVALDPDPDDLTIALSTIVEETNPEGPGRAMANHIYEEWQAVCGSPDCLEYFIREAAAEAEKSRHGQELPQ